MYTNLKVNLKKLDRKKCTRV